MPRRGSKREKEAQVRLLSQHPMVLEDFQRVLKESGMRSGAERLDSALAPDLRNRRVPPASVYVIDAVNQPQATEALLAAILEQYPEARVMVVTERLEDSRIFPLLRLGVKGLLRYADVREYLPRAVQAVEGGGYWVPRTLLSQFVDSVLSELRGRRPLEAPTGLSRREHEVLEALLENLSNKEIGNKLNISERTVKFHVSNLLGKFGVQRRADLILLHYQQRPPAS